MFQASAELKDVSSSKAPDFEELNVVESDCSLDVLQSQLNRQQVVRHSLTCTGRNIITHAGIAAVVGGAFSRVCLFVSTVTGKRLELSTPNLVYCIAVALHPLTQRLKGQRSRSHGYENRHGCTVASDTCCYGRCQRGLHVDTTDYVF